MGIPALFDDPVAPAKPERSFTDAKVEAAAVGYFVERIPEVLAGVGDELRLIDKPTLVYGELLGCGRNMHVREAVKQLHADGRIDRNSVGDFFAETFKLIG